MGITLHSAETGIGKACGIVKVKCTEAPFSVTVRVSLYGLALVFPHHIVIVRPVPCSEVKACAVMKNDTVGIYSGSNVFIGFSTAEVIFLAVIAYIFYLVIVRIWSLLKLAVFDYGSI